MDNDFQKEFWRLFELLEPFPKEKIREYWRPFGPEPVILTDKEHIDRSEMGLGHKVDIAATDGVSMYFRLDAIEGQKLDRRVVILHELAHCYLFSTRRFDLDRYRRSEKHRRLCEEFTIALSLKWLAQIEKKEGRSDDIL